MYEDFDGAIHSRSQFCVSALLVIYEQKIKIKM
jgi:hypothetical protein